jgi:hypothetical protein
VQPTFTSTRLATGGLVLLLRLLLRLLLLSLSLSLSTLLVWLVASLRHCNRRRSILEDGHNAGGLYGRLHGLGFETSVLCVSVARE